MVCTTHKNGKTMGMVDPIGLRTLTCASQVYLGVLLFREIHYDSLDGPGTLLKGVMTNTPWPCSHEAHLLLEQLKQRKDTCITCCNPSKAVKFHLELCTFILAWGPSPTSPTFNKTKPLVLQDTTNQAMKEFGKPRQPRSRWHHGRGWPEALSHMARRLVGATCEAELRLATEKPQTNQHKIHKLNRYLVHDEVSILNRQI